MSEDEHTYTNGEITVIWKPRICKHSGICARGLHQVSNPKARPWVDMAAAATEQITIQVQKCPSGALTFFRNEESKV